MTNEDWFSAYGSSAPSPTISAGRYTERKDVSQSVEIFVAACEFFKCEASNGNGGALCISTSDSSKVLVEKSMFVNCSASSDCGAIYVGNDGSCVISEVCGYGCTAKSSRLFSEITCTSDAQHKNDLIYSSIALSRNEACSFTNVIKGGIVSYKNNNFSNNKCKDCPAFWFNPSTSSSDVACFFYYNSISNNTATESRVVSFSNGGPFETKFCNIIDNEISVVTNYAIIWTNRKLTIENSCIIKNCATYTFPSSGNTNIKNCTLDSNVDSKKTGNIVIESITRSTFENALFHLTTGYCESKKMKKTRNIKRSKLVSCFNRIRRK